TTLIVVMSIVNGMNTYIADHIANMGANAFIVHQFQWATGEEEWLRQRRRNLPMRIEDYDFLRSNRRGYKNVGDRCCLPNPRSMPSTSRPGEATRCSNWRTKSGP